MKNYRRYKNCKIETICQMEVVKPPQPQITSTLQLLQNMGVFGSAGMATWQYNVPPGFVSLSSSAIG